MYRFIHAVTVLIVFMILTFMIRHLLFSRRERPLKKMLMSHVWCEFGLKTADECVLNKNYNKDVNLIFEM